MIKELKFESIIDNIIGDINEAKRKSESIFKSGNIKSSGDEVEDLIRDKISLFLPERYLVKQGHIINSKGQVSNQFDLIIFDRLNTPKFFETSNNTVYYPIESVLAVGEIKKTLGPKHLIEFGSKIKYLKEDMERKLISNSAFGGVNGDSSIKDLIHLSTNQKYKNPLFTFIFAIDGKDIHNLEIDDDIKYMPNDIYVLNHGYYLFGKFENGKVMPKIQDECDSIDNLFEIKKNGIQCFAMLLNQLINHLNKCQIEPFSISEYMSDLKKFGVKGSEITRYNI